MTMNSLTGLLKIRYPIIQAPMAGVSTAAMAAAVSEAGGLGSIAVGALDAARAQQMIAEVRERTARPFNVNVFCHAPAHADAPREAAWLAHLQPYFAEFGAKTPTALRPLYRSFVDDDAMLEMLLSTRPAVVSLHFGLPPQERIDALRQAGIVVAATATTLAEAQRLEEARIDLIVAQGVEAGGHRGVFEPDQGDAGIGTFALVRMLAQRCTRPVIATGGIMDGAGIAAALLLGAQAAQLGTAFVLAQESSANAAYRSMLKSARARDTLITTAISGRGARGIANRIMREVGAAHAPATPDYPIAYDAGKLLHEAASAAGSAEFAAHWAGQAAILAREMPAAQLLRTLVDETNAALRALPAQL
jgi:nitronate monooxygenase